MCKVFVKRKKFNEAVHDNVDISMERITVVEMHNYDDITEYFVSQKFIVNQVFWFEHLETAPPVASI